MRTLGSVFLAGAGLVAACSAGGTHVFSNTGGSAGAGASVATTTAPSSSSSMSGPGGAGGSGGGPTFKDGGLATVGSGGGGASTPCNMTDPMADMDGDGWTPAQGDCNDCDPNVNPGAIDTVSVGADGGVVLGDEDCDGIPGNVPGPCDDNLAVDDPDPMNAAKAVELCTPLVDPKKWGIKSAKWVLPDGSDPSMLMPVDPITPASQLQANYHLGHGILSAFGPEIHVQAGKRMLGLSSGTARQPTDPGYQNVSGFDKQYTANFAGMGFMPTSAACPGVMTGQPHDAVALEVDLVAPTNAHGISFNFNFYTYEWPDFICSEFNDYFLAFLLPIPMGQTNPNISFDTQGNPVSVNNALLNVCGCTNPGPPCFAGGKVFPCSLGDIGLVGTGFGTDTASSDHGSTGWLETKAPIKPHEEITIRWIVHDSTDGILDTSALIDNFQWIAKKGTIATMTTPVPQPK